MSKFFLLDAYGLADEYIRWVRVNGNGRNKDDCRFGQFICNHYLKNDESCAEVFYEEDATRAMAILVFLI